MTGQASNYSVHFTFINLIIPAALSRVMLLCFMHEENEARRVICLESQLRVKVSAVSTTVL